MARRLGCLEYADGTRRYFVHCGTSGCIFRALFATPASAHATYSEIGSDGLIKLRGQDRQVEVVKFARLSGWDDAYRWEFEGCGLATRDDFLEPLSDLYGYQGRCCLQLVDGLVHLAEEVDGGFSGNYDVPVCHLQDNNRASNFNPEATEFGHAEWFSRPLKLCEECVSVLFGEKRG